MGFIVDEMLEDLSKHGYTPEELKEVVISVLAPYFNNKEMLVKEAMQNNFLSIFAYFIVYNSDKVFSQAVYEVLEVYRKAYVTEPNKVRAIILETVNLMGQKENLMWTVKSNTPKEIPQDIHEATYKFMKHIGDVLEIGTKHEIIELYAILEVSLGKSIDYMAIRKRDFGAIVQSILDKKYFQNILKTMPNNIKISDWRNIAYHHTYEIDKDIIICNYGKKGDSFQISFDDLRKYAVKIIKSCNIIDIARRIFIFDNSSIFADIDEKIIAVDDRDIMKVGQLRTAFLGRGFKLLDMKINEEYEEAVIVDLAASINVSNDDKLRRRIHCAQFLYNIWIKFPKDRISIVYCENDGIELFRFSIDGLVCEKVSKGIIEFSDMIKFVTIEKLW